ncbi:MAG: hypothetical protein ACI8TQ_000400 [Planctomycetota bacterium]|jgi:hypothetical protein
MHIAKAACDALIGRSDHAIENLGMAIELIGERPYPGVSMRVLHRMIGVLAAQSKLPLNVLNDILSVLGSPAFFDRFLASTVTESSTQSRDEHILDGAEGLAEVLIGSALGEASRPDLALGVLQLGFDQVDSSTSRAGSLRVLVGMAKLFEERGNVINLQRALDYCETGAQSFTRWNANYVDDLLQLMLRAERHEEYISLKHERDAYMAVREANDLNGIAWSLVNPDRTDHETDILRGLDLARKAVALEPADHAIRDTLAWALFANGFHDEAINASMKALELAPDEEKEEFRSTLERLKLAIKDAASRASEQDD